MVEKLCLQWNGFKNNTIGALGRLIDDHDFSDVTLACEDGQQMEAHKVILAVSSPFFQSLLKRNKHPHPLIYMRGIKSENLKAIVDFLYCGEANVCQDNLDGFLAIAEELQLQGLSGEASNHSKVEEEEVTNANGSRFEKEFQSYNREPNMSKHNRTSTANESHQILGDENHPQNRALALVNSSGGDMHTLNENINPLLEKSSAKNTNGKTTFRCKVCGKESPYSNDIRKHIESHHLEGVFIPCAQCEKTFRSRGSLAMHIKRNHKIQKI